MRKAARVRVLCRIYLVHVQVGFFAYAFDQRGSRLFVNIGRSKNGFVGHFNADFRIVYRLRIVCGVLAVLGDPVFVARHKIEVPRKLERGVCELGGLTRGREIPETFAVVIEV